MCISCELMGNKTVVAVIRFNFYEEMFMFFINSTSEILKYDESQKISLTIIHAELLTRFSTNLLHLCIYFYNTE